MYAITVSAKGDMNMDLTANSAALLAKAINQADFDGENGMNEALMNFTSSEKGNLTDLKKKGYVETCEEDQNQYWVIFTEKSRPFYEAIKS